jgi:hypothetical protein
VSNYVDNFLKTLLQKMPLDAMLSVAIDCWTSPYQQSFVAICGYFIDASSQLHEVVLGFEPLYGQHSGENIGKVLVAVLRKHGVQDRLFALTTDNTSNNGTALKFVREHCKNHTKGRHIPCLAHVLQLSLGALLSNVRAAPSNECKIETWHDDMALSVYTQYGVGAVLEKVSCNSCFAVVLDNII